MSTTKTLYDNTTAKRLSEQREHLSNAALIGYANIYGLDIKVNVPSSFATAACPVNKLNLTVDETSLSPSNDGVTRITTSVASSKERRNERKSQHAEEMNLIIQYLFSVDPSLKYQLTKSRTPQKTVKLNKFKWIDPFNEEGFKMFGECVIQIISGMTYEGSNAVINSTGKKKVVFLPRQNAEIQMAYLQILQYDCYLTENGKAYRNRLYAEQQMQMEQQEMLYQYQMNEINQTNQNTQETYYYQEEIKSNEN